jgi:hypothetical protein
MYVGISFFLILTISFNLSDLSNVFNQSCIKQTTSHTVSTKKTFRRLCTNAKWGQSAAGPEIGTQNLHHHHGRRLSTSLQDGQRLKLGMHAVNGLGSRMKRLATRRHGRNDAYLTEMEPKRVNSFSRRPSGGLTKRGSFLR